MKQFFVDGTGQFSMMRLIAFVGLCLAVLCILSGVGLLAAETLQKLGTSNGSILVTIGFGIFTGGSLAKAWQAQAEAKQV